MEIIDYMDSYITSGHILGKEWGHGCEEGEKVSWHIFCGLQLAGRVTFEMEGIPTNEACVTPKLEDGRTGNKWNEDF